MKPVEIEILVKGDKTKSVISGMKSQADALDNAIKHVELTLEGLRTSPPVDLGIDEQVEQIEKLERQLTALRKQYNQIRTTAEGTPIVPPTLNGATSQFNGLSMSVQQLARELPSLAYGPQMFFMAISNNLPIFTDELAKAQKQYDATVASGQKGIPVWKQVAGSIFSPQTAIVALTMVLVTNGDQIVEWIGSLGKAKKSVEELAGVTTMMSDALAKGAVAAQSEMVQMETLRRAAESETLSREKRLQAVQQLQEQFPSYFAALSQEAILEGDVADAYSRTASAILAKAEAQALEGQIVKNKEFQVTVGGENVDAIRQLSDAYKITGRRGLTSVNVLGEQLSGSVVDIQKNILDQLKPYLDDVRDSISKTDPELAKQLLDDSIWGGSAMSQALNLIDYLDAIESENENISNQIVSLMSEYDLDDAISGANSGTNLNKSLEERQAQFLQLQLANDQARIDLMADGSAKRIEQLKLNYAQEIAELDKQEAEWRKAQGGILTAEQQGELTEARDVAKAQFNTEALDAAVEQNREAQEKSRKLIDELQAQTKTLEDERADLVQNYTTNINKMLASPEVFDSGHIAKFNADYQAALSEIDGRIAKSATGFQKVFEEASKKTVADLHSIIEEAEAMYEFLQGGEYDSVLGGVYDISYQQFAAFQNSDSLEEYKQRLEELRKILTQLNDESNDSVSSFDKLKKGLKDGDEKLFSAGLSELNNELATSIKLFNAFGEILSNLGEITQSGELEGLSEEISAAGEALSNVMSGASTGAAAGGPIGAVIGAVVGLAQTATSAFAENAAARRDYDQAVLEGIESQAALYLQTQRELAFQAAEMSTVFGTDSFGGALANLAIINTETKTLGSNMQALSEAQVMFAKSEKKWFTDGRVYGSHIVTWYESLLDVYPELLDAEGNLNEEYARGLLLREDISDENKDLIQDALDTIEVINQAADNVKSYFSTTFGEVGNIVSETFVSAFESGDVENAAENLGQNLSSIFEKMATDFAYAMHIAPILQQANKEIEALISQGLSGEDLIDAAVSIFNSAIVGVSSSQDDWNETVEKFKEMASSSGIDIFDDPESVTQTGKADAFQAMSYDQGTKLEGLFTALDIKVDLIYETELDIQENIIDMAANINSIEDNTRRSCEGIEELVSWSKKVDREGLKIK